MPTFIDEDDSYNLASSRHSKHDFVNMVQSAYTTPRSGGYTNAYDDDDDETPYWRNPSEWSPCRWIVIGLIVAVIIAAAVVTPIMVIRANKYPDYSELSYSLVDTYQGETFFDYFNYYTETDPADGFVTYVSSTDASSYNITYATSSAAIIRIDTSSSDATNGRKSARITSKTTYETGLFIFDIRHAPYGCALWPAVWLTDPDNWPTHGEIDVLEGMNTVTGNQVTLHTTSGCKMNVKRKETGTVTYTNCLNTTNSNAGCGVKGTADTFGPEFNSAGGGVYAMELRDAGIRTWFFNRSALPDDLSELNSSTDATNLTTSPNPYGWSEALADFPSTHCNIGNHFKNQSIIANIDLCGQGAGSTTEYTDDSSCSGTCTSYVASASASTWDDAYFEFGGFWVFQAS